MRSVSDSRQMRAWVVDRPGAIAGRPLTLVERPVPEPGPGQVRVRVSVCGVCRTDLHLAEGDLPPKHPAVTPGHEVVGRVDALGTGTSRFAVAQVAVAEGAEVHVFTRSAHARDLAMSLGAASASASVDGYPAALDSALLFAPVGSLIPGALEALDRGGTLAVAGIYVDEIPPLNYDRDLFQEKRL